MAASVGTRLCETPACNKEAKLQCPTCIKLGVEGSFFCSQECFKGSWNEHKKIHKKAKADSQPNDVSNSYHPWPGYSFTGKLRPYPQSAMRTVGDHIARPDYADHPDGVSHSERSMRGSTNIKVLNDEEIEGMRVAGKLAREVLDAAAAAIAVGVTTDEIDRIVHEASVDRECYPSPLNYYNFPKSCCTSINEVICHGIPDMRPLENGDICNVDVTVYHRGYHGDLNETLFVGEVEESSKKLVKVTWECLQKAMQLVKPGIRYREVGDVIQKHAQAHGYSVVRSYCGHGIHQLFHTAPSVPHYASK
ncbi:methionine aminopeptidase 1-like [Lingula anatina]|uniref:Methionine aminopeptidase n=1 Tax=Lingula anatina TaxID=7574 RepID=A0A1S3JL66_LINAN|nr:methionine aminopeptidase 1-like [Lingula anatina]|eukprot:XP_013411150.1 methionine aminopeptidase 1-like [Lingula anatina]